jgi:hypothetical protein
MLFISDSFKLQPSIRSDGTDTSRASANPSAAHRQDASRLTAMVYGNISRSLIRALAETAW